MYVMSLLQVGLWNGKEVVLLKDRINSVQSLQFVACKCSPALGVISQT